MTEQRQLTDTEVQDLVSMAKRYVEIYQSWSFIGLSEYVQVDLSELRRLATERGLDIEITKNHLDGTLYVNEIIVIDGVKFLSQYESPDK